MKKYLFLIVTSLILWACNSADNKSTGQSQEATTDQEKNSSLEVNHKASVEASVLSLFDGVRESNKEKISASLAGDAVFISAKETEGELVEKITQGSDFIEKAGAPHEKAWDERLTDIQVEVNDGAALLKANYEFYLGEEYSHKGEMKVDLAMIENQWLIKKVWYTVVKD